MSMKRLSRREFLQLGLLGAGGLTASVIGLRNAKDGMLPRPFPSPTPPFLGPPVVSIAGCPTYEPSNVEEAVRTSIDLIGGVSDVITPGDRVGIKPNLTSRHAGSSELGITTDVEVVRAVVAEIRARVPGVEIWILEGEYTDAFRNLGYRQLAAETGSSMINTDHPYGAFAEVQSASGLWYKSFRLNSIYADLDVLVSVSKLKIHSLAGITLSLKNLIGCMPLDVYRHPTDANRGPYVHDESTNYWGQLSRVVADINTTIPIHLSIVDGVIGRERGAGTWTPGSQPVTSGTILAGKNAVATDAVGCALMGHDPTTKFPQQPFVNGQNHLCLARDLGLGPNSLDQIDLRLEEDQSFEDLVVYFEPPVPDPNVPPGWNPDPVYPIPEIPLAPLLAHLM